MTPHLPVALSVMICLLSSQLDAVCPKPPVACEKLAEADVVFVGEVVERIDYRQYGANGQPMVNGIDQYRFKVTEVFKGDIPADFWALFYYNPGGDTDSFAPGRRYLVFAHRRVTGAFVAGCGWRRELRRLSEDEAVLAELRACLKKTP